MTGKPAAVILTQKRRKMIGGDKPVFFNRTAVIGGG